MNQECKHQLPTLNNWLELTDKERDLIRDQVNACTNCQREISGFDDLMQMVLVERKKYQALRCPSELSWVKLQSRIQRRPRRQWPLKIAAVAAVVCVLGVLLKTQRAPTPASSDGSAKIGFHIPSISTLRPRALSGFIGESHNLPTFSPGFVPPMPRRPQWSLITNAG